MVHGRGSGERGNGGCVLLYRSQDLVHWEYLHKLAEGKPNGKQTANAYNTGTCGNVRILRLGRPSLPFLFNEGKAFWTTGHYDAQAHLYTPTQQGVLDHGAYYAPKSFMAPMDGGFCGMDPETRPEKSFAAAGWSGAMGFPRVVSVDAQGQLQMRIAAESESLRAKAEHAAVSAEIPLRRGLPALSYELALKTGKLPHAVTVRLLTGGASAWELTLDFESGAVHCGDKSLALPRPSSASAELRWFLDGSVVESLIGEREALTSRIYTLKPDSTELEVSVAGAGRVDVDLWPLKPISPDRLTT